VKDSTAALMNERLVAQAENGSMDVRHLRLEGTNREIGRALARVARTRHGLTAETLKEVEAGQARRQAQFTRTHGPILWQRAMGVAEELGVDVDTHDVTSLSYNQLPTPIAPIGCSLVYYPPAASANGRPTLSRNYDFPLVTMADLLGIESEKSDARPMMGDPYLLELHPSDGGFASVTMCSFDLLGGTLDGINSRGLVVSANGDEIAWSGMPHTAPNGVGFYELSCMREVLDRCTTVEDARRILMEGEFFVSMIPCHYLVADRTGSAFVFERDPAGNAYVIEARDKPIVLTNHPLHRFPDRTTFPAPYGVASTGTTSFERQIHLEDMVNAIDGLHTLDDMASACRSVSVGAVLGRLPDAPRQALASSPGMARTLWHVVYDATARTMDIQFYVGEESIPDGGFRERYGEPIRLTLQG
jgi:predicted choloylglycine hydrolase